MPGRKPAWRKQQTEFETSVDFQQTTALLHRRCNSSYLDTFRKAYLPIVAHHTILNNDMFKVIFFFMIKHMKLTLIYLSA
jgi:hypothetical protein